MAAERLNTKHWSQAARETLGLAVTRAREAAGHRYRPSFAQEAKIGVRSLVKLEQGEPVGAVVYEAVGRALPGWTEDTPASILDGDEPPANANEKQAEFSAPVQARLDRIRRTHGAAAYLEAVELLRDAADERGSTRGA